MDFEAVVDAVLRDAAGLDASFVRFVREMVAAGEPDLALIAVLEDAPRVVPPSVVDAMDDEFQGSGNYAEREAVKAIDAYRATIAAA